MGWAYEIMHLERPVAVIDSDGICRIAEPGFLPYNLYLEEEEDISARIDNQTNLPVRLYPLMDFNKSFLAYDKIEGGRCLTSDQPISRLEAARHGVREVGLNQICEIQREWFESDHVWEMFHARLRELESSL